MPKNRLSLVRSHFRCADDERKENPRTIISFEALLVDVVDFGR